MAKKRSTKAKAKPKSEPAKAKDLMKMPSESVVRSLAKDIRSAKTEIGGVNEELSEVIAAAKKDKGVHPGALKRVEALVHKAKQTDRGLAAVATEMAHFHYYCDVLGLDKMLEQQGQMFARVEAGEKTPGDGQTHLEDAIEQAEQTKGRQTAEAAGAPVH